MAPAAWKRRYRYEEAIIRDNIRVITPISEDAPYEEQDARLWTRLLGLLVLGTALITAVVWLLS